MAYHSEAVDRISRFVEQREITVARRLGHGKDGVVVESAEGTAIKGFVLRRGYFKEINVYLRLLQREVTAVEGFAVPVLESFDDELMVIEMGIVSPPCVLDFANAGVDGPLHDFPAEILEAQEAENAEVFEDRWPIVQRIRSALRGHGVHIADLNPNNIMFPDED